MEDTDHIEKPIPLISHEEAKFKNDVTEELASISDPDKIPPIADTITRKHMESVQDAWNKEAKNIDLQKKLQASEFDPLLGQEGFYNRAKFYEHLDQQIQRINSNPEPRKENLPFQGAALIQIDLDEFKKANDAFGHPFGDKVLLHVAEIIKNHLHRSQDLVGRSEEEIAESDKNGNKTGRPGGDELAALLYDTNAEGAIKVCDAVRQDLVDNPIKDENGNPWVQTVSIGIYQLEKGVSIAEALERSDIAAYEGKRQGRNKTILWKPGMIKENPISKDTVPS